MKTLREMEYDYNRVCDMWSQLNQMRSELPKYEQKELDKAIIGVTEACNFYYEVLKAAEEESLENLK